MSHLKTYIFASHFSRSAVHASDTLTKSFVCYESITYL